MDIFVNIYKCNGFTRAEINSISYCGCFLHHSIYIRVKIFLALFPLRRACHWNWPHLTDFSSTPHSTLQIIYNHAISFRLYFDFPGRNSLIFKTFCRLPICFWSLVLDIHIIYSSIKWEDGETTYMYVGCRKSTLCYIKSISNNNSSFWSWGQYTTPEDKLSFKVSSAVKYSSLDICQHLFNRSTSNIDCVTRAGSVCC